MSQTAAILKPLAWTDPAPPNETGCRYDHVTAETPVGQFSIEWKSWKAHDSRDLFLAGEYVKSCDDLDEAKQAAFEHLSSLVGGCIIELSPEAFERFEKALDANPMAENGALQALLARPKPWAEDASTVPKHKFDCLVAHAKFQDATIAELRAHCHNLELYHNNEAWHWQHDGQDFLESLTCPVVIQPHHLRELIACAPEVRDTLYRSELKKEQDGFDIRIKAVTEACADEFIAYKKSFTYSSDQATNCAGCGKHKHTPLRVDSMGGYVCLTCIDTRLEELLAEESAREVEKDWDGCQEVADLPSVHMALMAFSGDSTGDSGVMLVQAVIEALAKPQTPKALELTPDLRWILGQMCFQHIHTAQALRVMGHQIARKAEDEQAVTLHWLLGHYLRDPVGWREKAAEELRAGAAAEAAKPTEEGAI